MTTLMCWVSQATRFQKGKFQKKLWCRVVGGRGGGGQQDNWLLCKAATVREVLKPTFRALLLYQNERRMDARNVSSRRNSLRWSIFIINSVYKTKFSCYTPLPTQHHSFFRNLPLYSCLGKLLLVSSFLF